MRAAEVADGGHFTAPAPLPRWFTPGTFVLLPVAMSFIAWSTMVGWRALGHPTSSWAKLSGFAEPARSGTGGIILLLVWYCSVLSISTLGWRLGGGKELKAEVTARITTPVFERRYFLLVTAIAFLGVAYSYYKIGSAQSILGSLSTQSNQFTNSVPAYAGIQTFRSATILSAPIGIYLWRKQIVGLPYMVGGIALLLLNSMIASRLSLFMAGLVYLVIWVKSRKPSDRKSPRHAQRLFAVAALAIVGFGVLTGLNFFRNALYYEAAGVTNPVVMNLYQMGAYLATPAQVSIGVADAVMRGTWEQPDDPVNAINAVQPTFLQFNKVAKSEGLKNAHAYGYAVPLEPNFTTNSVFADTYSVYGMWGWVYTVLLYAVAGFLFARVLRYGVVLAGTAGVMAYSLAEVWRTQIVNFGFVIFLLLLTVGCAVLALLWERFADNATDD